MSERPWIEVPPHSSVPVAVGTPIDIRQRDGSVFYCWPYLSETDSLGINSDDVADNVGWHPDDIIAYRLHDNGQAEAERRAERMEQFRKIADSGKWDIAPVKSPQKVGAGQ